MGAVFLSHSSGDNAIAAALKQDLEAHGHTVFLDFDPEVGIGGGETWEKTLSDRIGRCSALVPLLSPDWIASRWSVAELFHARAIGKIIVPVTIRAHSDVSWLAHLQRIDFTRDAHDGLLRLLRALEDVHPVVPGRLPYPGLAAYTEDDAAVFFGRDPEMAAGLELLESLRRRGRVAARLLLVLGASGSGKSSLVRAGVVPRLRKRDRDWIVLPVVRPRLSPVDELATSLAAALADAGASAGRATILRDLASGDVAGQPSRLLMYIRDLRVATQRVNATALLVVDQMEELFSAPTPLPGPAQAEVCLALLRKAIVESDDELVVVGTMRSDFLGTFQQHPFTGEDERRMTVHYAEWTVDPLPASRLEQVIAGPATRFGVTVDAGLMQKLTEDVQTTAQRAVVDAGAASRHKVADALPLLAFALRRLWAVEQSKPNGTLDLDDYKEAGALEGTIETAVAEALPRIAEQRALLRSAFIPGLVHVTVDGVRTRKRSRLADLPAASIPLLERLVDARLLVKDRDEKGQATIEVTHEAVLRMWPDLAKWIDEDEYKLRVLDGISRAAQEWRAASERADLLVHRDGRLSDSLAVLKEWTDTRIHNPLEPETQRYLAACEAAQREREEAARTEVERRRLATQIIWRRTAIGLGAAIVLGGVAFYLSGSLVRTRAEARDNQRLALARLWMQEDPTIGGLVAAELEKPERVPPLELAGVLLDALSAPAWSTEFRHPEPVRWVDVSPDGRLIATASTDNIARIWHADGRATPAHLPHPAQVLRARFSPDGELLVTSSIDGTIQLWRTSDQTSVAVLSNGGSPTVALAFSADSARLVAGMFDGQVRIWSTAPPFQALSNSQGDEAVSFVSFDPSGNRWLAGDRLALRLGETAENPNQVRCIFKASLEVAAFTQSTGQEDSVTAVTRNGEVHRFPVSSVKHEQPCVTSQSASSVTTVVSAALTSTGGRAVTLQVDGVITIWEGLSKGVPRSSVNSSASYVGFSPSGQHFATAHENGTVSLWDVKRPERPVVLARHLRGVRHVAFGKEDTLVATASDDNTVRLWRVGEDPAQVVKIVSHERNVADVRFSVDGTRVVSASIRGEVQLSALDGTTKPEWRFSHPPQAKGAVEAHLSPRGDWVLSIGSDGQVRMWRSDIPRSERRTRVLKDPKDGATIVQKALFNADGSRIVTGWADGTARVWSVDDEAAEPVRFYGHVRGERVTALAIHGGLVASASTDATARVWEAATGREVHTFSHGIAAVDNIAFSPSGDRVATTASEVVHVWSLSGAPAVELHPQCFIDVAAFSSDGTRIVTGCNDGIVRVWPASGSGDAVLLSGHEDGKRIVTAVFSGNGDRVLTASEDGTARIWNADGTGRPVILRHGASLTAAALSRDGELVATGGIDSKVRLWPFNPSKLLEGIRARTRTCLPPDFRVQHFLEAQKTATDAHRACEATRGGGSPR